jgi:probable addiction module antidote protein
MSKTTTSRYDIAGHLRTPEEMAACLEACLEEARGDASFVVKALGDIARAKGMTQVARDAGLSRESLYKALSGERTPGFDTILKVVQALDMQLHAVPARTCTGEASKTGGHGRERLPRFAMQCPRRSPAALNPALGASAGRPGRSGARRVVPCCSSGLVSAAWQFHGFRQRRRGWSPACASRSLEPWSDCGTG